MREGDGMRIGLMVGATEGPDGTLDGLVAAALDGGGSDNVTVVLVRSH